MSVTFNKTNGGVSFDSNREKKQKFEKQTGFKMNAKSENISQTKVEELKVDYQQVIVHDFGDDYHLSEEEKAERFQYYEAFKKVRRCKRKYRKLSEYIVSFRLCLECLDVIANNNGLYPPNKFKEMVAQGLIHVFGLNFPKYVGRDKKMINWEYVAKIIADKTVDPHILDSAEEFDADDIDDIDEYRKIMFGDLYDYIFEDKELEEYDESLIIKNISPDKQKKLISNNPEMFLGMRDLKRKVNRSTNLSSYVFEVSESDFEYIERLDSERNIESGLPTFKGSLLNDNDFNKYMHELNEYENEKIKVSYKGKNKTPDEIRMIKLKDELESAGWNVRALYKSTSVENKEKKKIKEDKKKEKKLKKKLIEIQKRREKKKKKKNKDDDGKKSKDKVKKEKYKEEVNEYFDDMLMSNVPDEQDYEDFKDYKNDMLDFTYENIM